MMMAQEAFVTAEVEYRRDRASKQYGRVKDRRVKGRGHRVPRRPSLHLPSPRRRPLSLA